MSETQIKLPIPGTNLFVYGLLREVQNAPTVVLIHGLGGSLQEHIHYNGAHVFEAAGYSVLRVSLYGGEEDSRNLMDCTVDTHVTDVEIMLHHLRAKQKRIAVVGHSLGGLVVQRLDRSLFDVAVLWDPADVTMPHFREWPGVEWSKALEMWIMHWGIDVLVSKELEDSWWKNQVDHHDLGCPTKIIAAGATWLPETSRRYAKAQTGPSQFTVIDGADHSFEQGEFSQQLHTETVNWLQQYL